ncbi:MAG: RHS repeat-associated core domain-containing protein [Anaerolineae bacterium]|jgi:RHS repeat-associated protein|nr:RHS repeat-associated core domain-containing protein [Anaerolineae bacterium]
MDGDDHETVNGYARSDLTFVTNWRNGVHAPGEPGINGTVVTGTLGYTQAYTYNAIADLLGKSDVGTYTYPDSGESSVRLHAVVTVTRTSGNWSFGYDANGNMVTRVLSGTTYTLVYDAENRLIQYKQGSTVLASYVYDGDGTLVKRVVGGQTTVYVSPSYEKNLTTSVVTKYYYLGGQRVAMRVDGTLTYLHADHLGSASLTTNTSRAVVGDMRYSPYGQTRWITGTVGTDRRYTGQREEAGLGLYDYLARRYDPLLGRFIQADTLVPEPGNPQSLNRYSYVYNNPLKYTDPTGHCVFGVDTIVCIAVGGAIVGAAVGYGAQVYGNMQRGMAFGDALTTDIEPTPILQGLFLGGAVATAGAYVATALGIGAGTGAVAGSAATAACADGDCSNEARAVGSVVSEVVDDAGLGVGTSRPTLRPMDGGESCPLTTRTRVSGRRPSRTTRICGPRSDLHESDDRRAVPPGCGQPLDGRGDRVQASVLEWWRVSKSNGR